jgi:ABC-2 type transport system ATP-binding protein
MAAAARELRPMNERELFGRHIFLFDNANRAQLKELGEVRTPSVADLFVAIMNGGES